MSSELWQRLKAARGAAQIKQHEIAERAGVSRVAVGLWESPDPKRRTEPSDAALRIYAELTGAPYAWIISDSSDINPHWRTDGEHAGSVVVDIYDQDQALAAVVAAAQQGSLVRDMEMGAPPAFGDMVLSATSRLNYPAMDAYAFVMPDNSAGRLVAARDVVIVDARYARHRPGDLVVVNTIDAPESLTVRNFWLRQDEGGLRGVLSAESDDYPETLLPPEAGTQCPPVSGPGDQPPGTYFGRVVSIIREVPSGAATH